MALASYCGNNQFDQTPIRLSMNIPEARIGMCAMLTINWMLKVHESESIQSGFDYIRANSLSFYAQVASQTRYYKQLNPSASSIEADVRTMVSLASAGSMTLGYVEHFTPALMMAVIARGIEGRNGEQLHVALRTGTNRAHAIAMAIDADKRLGIFDPNCGMVTIRLDSGTPLTDSGIFGIIISEIRHTYSVQYGQCARTIPCG